MDEREHCKQALLRLGRQFDADMEPGSAEFQAAVDLLVHERAPLLEQIEELRAELRDAHTALGEDGWGNAGWAEFREWQESRLQPQKPKRGLPQEEENK